MTNNQRFNESRLALFVSCAFVAIGIGLLAGFYFEMFYAASPWNPLNLSMEEAVWGGVIWHMLLAACLAYYGARQNRPRPSSLDNS